MSRSANCPSCGAPVTFLWSSAVQTACPFCHSILVRHDVDLERVGEVADLPQDASPIQLMTAGVFDNRNFQVVGRLVYEWDQGRWNEWHLAFNDGESGWLSDAQLQYAVSFQVQPPAPLPEPESIRRGMAFNWTNGPYLLTHITSARYIGFEGDLPFTTTDHQSMKFADLRTPLGRFGTIDYSEHPPLLYLGREVTFAELKLQNVRQFEGW